MKRCQLLKRHMSQIIMGGIKMSVREYIGARYVPLFSDPIEWDDSNSYEPLTVVTYQGGSYVSKQSVPVGVSIENEDYWLLWADYNAQIEAYRAEVQANDAKVDKMATNTGVSTSETESPSLATKISNIASNTGVSDTSISTPSLATRITSLETLIAQNDLMLAFGDSFGEDTDCAPYYWWKVVADILHLNVKSYCSGGDGFTPTAGQTTFTDQLNAASLDESFDNDDAKIVILYGGLNDHGHGYLASDVHDYIVQYINTAKQNFPNAKIVICGTTTWQFSLTLNEALVNSFRADYGTYEAGMRNLMRETCYANQCIFIDTTFVNYGRSDCFSAGLPNYAHFSQAGGKRMGSFIASALMGNATFTNVVVLTPVLKSSGGVALSSDYKQLRYVFTPNMMNLQVGFGNADTSALSDSEIYIDDETYYFRPDMYYYNDSYIGTLFTGLNQPVGTFGPAALSAVKEEGGRLKTRFSMTPNAYFSGYCTCSLAM